MSKASTTTAFTPESSNEYLCTVPLLQNTQIIGRSIFLDNKFVIPSHLTLNGWSAESTSTFWMKFRKVITHQASNATVKFQDSQSCGLHVLNHQNSWPICFHCNEHSSGPGTTVFRGSWGTEKRNFTKILDCKHGHSELDKRWIYSFHTVTNEEIIFATNWSTHIGNL